MNRIRALIAALLLVWSPFSGVIAEAFGATLEHHHCNDVWHDHADTHGVVVKGDDCATRGIDLDAASCDDCQFAFAAIPATVIELERPALPSFHTVPIVTAQNKYVFAHFRPPKA
jgi:hypothetical protein